MKSYNNFVGIDIGKFEFVATSYQSNQVDKYENTASGIASFIKAYKPLLKQGLCVLETTGGYEMKLLLTLCDKGFAVHRAHARQVKHFIRSYRVAAKTDKLDAQALALYGYERHAHLDVFARPSVKAMELYELVMRRQELKQMRVAEKNRLQGPRSEAIKGSCATLLKVLSSEIDAISKRINCLIDEDPLLKAKKAVLKTIPGIGEVIASELLILLPELGSITRRQIASLAGVAPISKDSGRLSGYRRTGQGRQGIKPLLFLAAMSARNSNTHLKVFYEDLTGRGKKKMVALTALMRKLIVMANARLKEFMTTGELPVSL